MGILGICWEYWVARADPGHQVGIHPRHHTLVHTHRRTHTEMLLQNKRNQVTRGNPYGYVEEPKLRINPVQVQEVRIIRVQDV